MGGKKSAALTKAPGLADTAGEAAPEAAGEGEITMTMAEAAGDAAPEAAGDTAPEGLTWEITAGRAGLAPAAPTIAAPGLAIETVAPVAPTIVGWPTKPPVAPVPVIVTPAGNEKKGVNAVSGGHDSITSRGRRTGGALDGGGGGAGRRGEVAHADGDTGLYHGRHLRPSGSGGAHDRSGTRRSWRGTLYLTCRRRRRRRRPVELNIMSVLRARAVDVIVSGQRTVHSHQGCQDGKQNKD